MFEKWKYMWKNQYIECHIKKYTKETTIEIFLCINIPIYFSILNVFNND